MIKSKSYKLLRWVQITIISIGLIWFITTTNFNALYALISAIFSLLSSINSKSKIEYLPLKENKDYYISLSKDYGIFQPGLTRAELIDNLKNYNNQKKSISPVQITLMLLAVVFLLIAGIFVYQIIQDKINMIHYVSPASNQNQYYEPQSENDSIDTESIVFEIIDTQSVLHIDSIVRIYDESLLVSFSQEDPTVFSRVLICNNLGYFPTLLMVWQKVIDSVSGQVDTIFRYPIFEIQTLVDPNNICSNL